DDAEREKKRKDAERLVAEAYPFLVRHEFLAARETAERALNLDGTNIRAHAVLGNALLWLRDRDDDFGKAEAELRAAGEKDPNLPLVHVGLGTSAYLRGLEEQKARRFDAASRNFDAAVAELQRAVDAEPNNILAHN